MYMLMCIILLHIIAKLVPRGGLFVNKDHARSNRESPPNDTSPNGAISPRSKDRPNDITSPLTSPTTADRALVSIAYMHTQTLVPYQSAIYMNVIITNHSKYPYFYFLYIYV